MPWCLVCLEDGKGLEIVQILGHEVDVNFTLSFTFSPCQIQTSATAREISSSISDMRRYTSPTKSKLPNSGPRHWNVASAARKKRLPVLEAFTSIRDYKIPPDALRTALGWLRILHRDCYRGTRDGPLGTLAPVLYCQRLD